MGLLAAGCLLAPACVEPPEEQNTRTWDAQCLLAPGCVEPPAVAADLAVEPAEPAEPVGSVRPVRYVHARAAGARRTRTFAGVARAGSESSLSFRVGGMIARVDVGVGERVRAGDPIARIDAVDYELQVKEAEAALRQADALAGNAAADLRRAWALYENDNLARTELDGAIASADSAAAQVEAAAKRLERAQRQVRYATLVAPASGVIARVLVADNENVAGGQPVVVLTSDAVPEVEFSVPEGLIGEIREETPVSVSFNAIPNRRFSGSVTEVGVAATATGTMYTVAVRLESGASTVRPGMAAEVAVDFAGAGEVGRVVVPAAAVAEDLQGRFVFIVEPTGDGLAVARRRPVTVGAMTSDGFEIVAGLAQEDRVMSAGVSRVTDGDLVRLQVEAGDFFALQNAGISLDGWTAP